MAGRDVAARRSSVVEGGLRAAFRLGWDDELNLLADGVRNSHPLTELIAL